MRGLVDFRTTWSLGQAAVEHGTFHGLSLVALRSGTALNFAQAVFSASVRVVDICQAYRVRPGSEEGLRLTCNATVGEALRLGRMQAWAITIGGASDLMAGDVAAVSVFPRRFVAMSHLLLWRPTPALARISGPTPGADGTNI